MLVKRSWKPNSKKRRKTEVIPFNSCIKHLKYYFTNIERIRNLLKRGQTIETPYFDLNIQDAESIEEHKIHWHDQKALPQGRAGDFSFPLNPGTLLLGSRT